MPCLLHSSHYQLLPKALKSSGSSGEEEMSDIIRESERESSYFIALPSPTQNDDVVKFLLLSPTFFVHGGGDSKDGDGVFHLLILSSYLLCSYFMVVKVKTVMVFLMIS